MKANLNKAYFAYVKDLTASLNTNPKRFWSFVKSRTKKQNTPGCIIYKGSRALTPEEKANVFNQFFCSVFNDRTDNLSSTPGRGRDYSTVFPAYLIHDLICTPIEVAKVLKSLNVNKACGPDGVSPRLLNECHMELAPILARLFNYTLSRGTLPIDWKSANVVPIFKSGEQTAVDNYRPVSLTSVIVKSLERLVHNHIMNFLSDNKLLCDNQHGFRPLRSCVTQLLQLVHEWLRILEERGSVDAIFLDFAKAFDKVSHPHLLLKLQHHGINGQLLDWITDFLTTRRQRVIIDGHSSGWSEVTSGVPQGSILGPLLSLVYINDFPLAVKCNCGLFADDSILHRKVASVSDFEELQTDLYSAYDWCNSWLVTLKSEKSKVLHLSKSKDPRHHEYWLSDKPLSAVDHHKHLGVWLESSLSWDYHINYICAKANKVLGLIRRTFGSHNPEGVTTAYKTLVRPILEYGCQVWNPYLVKHIKSIESVQKRATRVICGSEKEYQERLGTLKWPSLELRRKFICLVQMCKIIFGHRDLDPNMFFRF